MHASGQKRTRALCNHLRHCTHSFLRGLLLLPSPQRPRRPQTVSSRRLRFHYRYRTKQLYAPRCIGGSRRASVHLSPAQAIRALGENGPLQARTTPDDTQGTGKDEVHTLGTFASRLERITLKT
jgi:hypothetical protein